MGKPWSLNDGYEKLLREKGCCCEIASASCPRHATTFTSIYSTTQTRKAYPHEMRALGYESKDGLHWEKPNKD